ncbi:MAG: hypothetical protein KC561_06005 [Myxococcales bacterium]|nr:hypothetical protein [Myxococcales bacterium]
MLRSTSNHLTALLGLASCLLLAGCPDQPVDRLEPDPVVPAENIYAPLGDPVPTATATQRATFTRGQAVARRQFSPEEGLGPLFNVTFCASCHERPALGGSAGHYRDFYIQGQRTSDGSLVLDSRGGVVASFGISGADPRPALYESTNNIAARNPIPFFGVGLIAEIPDEVILANADPDDLDGDGISGRPNFERGFVGRFGRKSQTTSIEGFIRGPLFNHLGVTTDPLTEAQLDALPVPSGREATEVTTGTLGLVLQPQVSAPASPLTDDDAAPDPEMTTDELFDLVSWAMLLAAPEPEPLNELGREGLALFHEVQCAACHVPMLEGPRGGLPLYSDLLLHDMGEDLADGLTQGVAMGSEFRTQPLWGVAAVGPYLHDGRADTMHDAIMFHAGEAQNSRDQYAALSADQQDAIEEFLFSLGGRSQYSPGLIPLDAEIPAVGELGGPQFELSEAERERWLEGRAIFDLDHGVAAGLGPLFNGDSCRACHFEPTFGGAGPMGVNVMRHGSWVMDGFTSPDYGTILHRLAAPLVARREHTTAHNTFEFRQTPQLFGLGLIETIPDETILALADPEDLDQDGITGVAHVLSDGRLGRFGWKAQVPSVIEFARDALSAEVGLTVPEMTGLTFGFPMDSDSASDPEVSREEVENLAFFMSNLAAPTPRASNTRGRQVFSTIGCDSCHVPVLQGSEGPVPLYSDLLLHAVAEDGTLGIPDTNAGPDQFRTAPLWGVGMTAPYMHDGMASTLEAAIEHHHGEADASRTAFEQLPEADQAALLDFLENL